ncbi:MAG: bifunctional nuclease family protein [Phycisphaerales bacterium]|jgi:hypothetical protein|nr:bifunctional nuclease family protein [Phycisphaerales bacterium]
MLVEMELSRILIREVTDAQIIELREVDGDRAFPIVIGMPEAFAIERSLKGIEPPRPQTHDLLLSMVESLGCSLTQVVIDNLREGTFFAKLYLVKDGNEIVVDSRPSDAIALGVARKIPIFVAESVLHEIERNPIDHDGQDFDTDQFDWD